MADVVLETKLVGDPNDLLRAMDKGVKAGDDFERSMVDAGDGADKGMRTAGDGIMGTFKKIAGAAALVFAGKQFWDFTKAAVDAASDLNEAGTAVEAVFGTSYDSIRKWSEGAASAMGLSTLQALDAAKTFGVYGQAAGLASSANAGFSQDLVHLASDLASFHNANPADVLEALGSGLRGEAEPLRKFGILLNDATLQQEALKLGIWDGNGQLNNQQKILAANAAIMDQAGVATGDFTKTSAGLANQQRIMEANWTNLSASIGTVFLPIIAATVGAINSNLFPVLQKGADWLNKGLGPAFENASKTIGPAMDAVFAAVGPLIPQVISLLSAFSPLGLVFKAITPVLPILVDLFSKVAGTLSGALGSVLPIITDLVERLATVLSGALASAIPIVVSIVDKLSGVLDKLMPVIVDVAGALGDALMTGIEALLPVFDAVLPLVETLFDALLPLVAPVLDLVKAFLPLIDVIAQLIGPIMQPLIDLLTAVLGPILDLVSPLVDLLAPALTFVADVITVVVQGIAGFIGWVVDMNSAAAKQGGGVMGVFKQIGDVIGSVIDGIGGVIDWIANLIQSQFNTISLAVKLLSGVFGTAFGAMGKFISVAFESALGVAKGAVNTIIDLINGAIKGINSIKVSIPDWIPLIGGQTWGVNLPTIPRLATGGTIVAPGLTWVGERGPELVNLPRGATVVPAHYSVDLADSMATAGNAAGNTTYDIKVYVDGRRDDDDELGAKIGSAIRFSTGG